MAMEAEQFCRWLDGARELGAFRNSEVDEGQKKLIEERLREVLPPVVFEVPHAKARGTTENPWWKFVRNFRGLVDLSVRWTDAYHFSCLLGALQALCMPVKEAQAPASRCGLA
jgi:hypothetical protein